MSLSIVFGIPTTFTPCFCKVQELLGKGTVPHQLQRISQGPSLCTSTGKSLWRHSMDFFPYLFISGFILNGLPRWTVTRYSFRLDGSIPRMFPQGQRRVRSFRDTRSSKPSAIPTTFPAILCNGGFCYSLITAFNPAQSPPPVNTPILFYFFSCRFLGH